MDRGPMIFVGVFLTFSAAWLALVVAPFLQLGQLEPVRPEGGAAYPEALGGTALWGRDIYVANGCIYCHSQQIRPEGFGADIARGWGIRRTVARDYLYDKPILIGTARTGPDLTNIGKRQPRDWHHKHLYNPRITSPGSTMPAFAFLYDKRKIVGERTRLALELPEELRPEAGFEIVPKEEAEALVAYLLSLNKSEPLEEADK